MTNQTTSELDAYSIGWKYAQNYIKQPLQEWTNSRNYILADSDFMVLVISANTNKKRFVKI